MSSIVAGKVFYCPKMTRETNSNSLDRNSFTNKKLKMLHYKTQETEPNTYKIRAS